MNRWTLMSLLLFGGAVLAQQAPVATSSAEATSQATVSAQVELVAADEPGLVEAPDGGNEDVPVASSGGTRTMLGMSILGNEEAPKSLVIVPWKSSEIGDGIGVSDSMQDRAVPVDKEVFLREVHYYELRSGGDL